MWKKDDYLSDADADPRIMKSSTLLKLKQIIKTVVVVVAVIKLLNF